MSRLTGDKAELLEVAGSRGVRGGDDGVGDEGIGLDDAGEMGHGCVDGELGGVEGDGGRGGDGDAGGVEADEGAGGVLDEDGAGGVVEGDALAGGGFDDDVGLAEGGWERGAGAHGRVVSFWRRV